MRADERLEAFETIKRKAGVLDFLLSLKLPNLKCLFKRSQITREAELLITSDSESPSDKVESHNDKDQALGLLKFLFDNLSEADPKTANYYVDLAGYGRLTLTYNPNIEKESENE
ncbi:MAG: hypothetical protein LBO72_07305 [Helicobacteraceae bacterium]|jgi:hypothetical protein|nr:hypothetical protein [Helicobacteraceae bacterium]